MGYAYIYSAFEKVPIQNISISFVITPKPVKLLDYLVKECEFGDPGICYVKGDDFPVQIIESRLLSETENVFLKNLRSELTEKDMLTMLIAYNKYGQLNKTDVYLNRIIEANPETFKEVIMSETVNDILYNTLSHDAL